MYEVPSSKILDRGQRYFEKVYGKVSKRIMGQMERSGTEDLGLTARLMYGYILSNTNVLNPAETSFVMIAGLIPMDVSQSLTLWSQNWFKQVNPQLKGHLRGALNGGATVEEVRAVREVVIQICKASGMKTLGDDVPGGWGWREEVANI
jgi:alkylhydroperoxidase/carboxymuconolactone decarboxylase family protein YurZ